MTVTLTREMEAEIQKKRRLLEKRQVFPYAYRKGNSSFYYVLLYRSRFREPTGNLILCNVPEPSREEQLAASRAFYQFNRVLGEASLQLIPDIERPVELLSDVKRHLLQVQWQPGFGLEKFADGLQRLYQVLDLGVGAKKEADIDLRWNKSAGKKRAGPRVSHRRGCGAHDRPECCPLLYDVPPGRN